MFAWSLDAGGSLRRTRPPGTVSGVFPFATDEPEAFGIVSRFVVGGMSREEFAYELAGLWWQFDGPFLRMVLHAAAVCAKDDDPNLLRRELSARMCAESTPVYGLLGGVGMHVLEKRTGRGSTNSTTFYV